MAGEIGIDSDGPDGPDVDAGEMAGGAALAGAAVACLACGAAITGEFCANCGQKNDDMRRSSLVLARDFLTDTFGFDSRMWRTIGLMAIAPGAVPSNYAHGKRSRYTPPIRFFLVSSFIFFVTLALTSTLFIAVEVTRKTEAAVAAERARVDAALENLSDDARLDDKALAEFDGREVACPINFRLRFFVRPQNVAIDDAAWRECADNLRSSASAEINRDGAEVKVDGEASTIDPEDAMKLVDRALTGVTAAVENPQSFNRDVNEWLARVMFLMTPVLALLLGVFIRGRDALLFDHLVLSLYAHATGFVIVGLGILAAMFGVAHAELGTALAIGAYVLIAVKRAYRRGWIKTVLATAFVSLAYFIVLSGVVMAIVFDAVWR